MTNQKSFKIAIASGKGGTGKTTLSTNLAAFIAEQEEVLLVDLDVEEPNSGLFIESSLKHEEENLKMIPHWDAELCTLCGLCQKVCQYHAVIQLGPSIIVFPELCHSCYACSELCPAAALPMISKRTGMLRDFQAERLHLVESRLDIGEEQAVSTIAHTKKYSAEKYGHIRIAIFDSPPGTSCPMLEATKDADFVILVTEPTPFGLHDLSLAVETMRSLNKKFGVVINRDGIGNDAVNNYCIQENIPVLAKIPNSRQIAELYSSGKLIYQHFPAISEALARIIHYCTLSIQEGRA
ncbi:MAG: ATP-binding protein [Lentimicrobiaceae bacterium]|nr:ATP-binding protein [Lentimicrobiaceae bacterium]MCO5266510.1 ATP-binding protein [Lentimicrobium sp.]